MEQLLEIEPTLKIKKLREVGEEFESAMMNVYWAIDVTFSGTTAFKLIEHQAKSAYIRIMRANSPFPPFPVPIPVPTPTPNPYNPTPNRAERRRRDRRRG